MSSARAVRVPALAKINLDLRVLNRRPDGFHELRTIFQTVSLADTLDIEFTPARRTTIEIACEPAIPDNISEKAARRVMDAMRATGAVRVKLTKRIPMGGGLGGGSSDAAAVLLALPVLAGRTVALPDLIALATELGSDVPFFLLGGTAAAIGRGTELFPLSDWRGSYGILLAPPVHVSTADAYSALGRGLTLDCLSRNINSFQSLAWSCGEQLSRGAAQGFHQNDFEGVVFKQHPQLGSLKRKLRKLGADTAMMTGSGAALFGFFDSSEKVEKVVASIRGVTVIPIRAVGRAGYRTLWWRSLRAHIDRKIWPPQSRYAR